MFNLQGWMWVNEAQVEMNHPPRWGYIAATPGKVLTLKVSASESFLGTAPPDLPTSLAWQTGVTLYRVLVLITAIRGADSVTSIL